MKNAFVVPLLIAAAICVGGCTSYQYRIVQPPVAAGAVVRQPIIIKCDPLEYHLSKRSSRLSMRIINPTEDRITLEGGRSFVVDPRGESHPIQGKVIGPRSYAELLLPPIPARYPVYGPGLWGPGPAWAWGWRTGWYPPYYDPFWGAMYTPPPSFYEVHTPFDWEWKEGSARLRLSYEQSGKTFEHDFDIVREKEK